MPITKHQVATSEARLFGVVLLVLALVIFLEVGFTADWQVV